MDIVRKEVMHLFRDRMTLRIALLVPVLQFLIFGYAIDFDVRHITTVVVDKDNSRESRYYLQRLRATQYLDIVAYANTPTQAATMLRRNDARVGVVIPEGFGRESAAGRNPQVNVLVDGSDSQVSLRARFAFLNPPAKPDPGVPDTRLSVLFNPDQRTVTYMIPGLIAVILQVVTAFLTAFSIVREKEQGTLEQLIVTPIGRIALMLGKITPYAGLAVVELCAVLFLANLIFGLQINGSLFALGVITVPFVLACLSIGLLISTLAQTQTQALQMSQLVIMPSIILAGYIAPRETMPGWLYLLSAALPATHYMQVTRGIIVRGAGLWDLMPQFFALLAIAAILVAISTARFRKSLG